MQHSIRMMGLMSGTSLDGLDVAVVDFTTSSDEGLQFELCAAETIAYDEHLEQALAGAHRLDAESWHKLHVEYGSWMAHALSQWFRAYKPKAVALHGHTIFHQPYAGITVPMGHGGVLAALLETRVICDFRSMDVALSGQGAPLVPFAEQLLYPGYRAFLNLGGIANISLHHNHSVMACDVVPCNQVFNHLARQAGMPFDEGGALARSGSLLPDLLDRFQQWTFLHQPPPKSLGREDVGAFFLPLLDAHSASISDKLHTAGVFAAAQIAALSHAPEVLVTGGGALNTWFLEQLAKAATHTNWQVPNKEMVMFKEAIAFAALGLQVLLEKSNTLPSATGASRALISGAVYNGCRI